MLTITKYEQDSSQRSKLQESIIPASIIRRIHRIIWMLRLAIGYIDKLFIGGSRSARPKFVSVRGVPPRALLLQCNIINDNNRRVLICSAIIIGWRLTALAHSDFESGANPRLVKRNGTDAQISHTQLRQRVRNLLAIIFPAAPAACIKAKCIAAFLRRFCY